MQEELDAYARQARAFPLLSPEEERTLGDRIVAGRLAAAALQDKSAGNVRQALHAVADGQAAQRRLAEAFLRLALAIAWEFRPIGVLDRLDLIQEANVGLIDAAARYDPDQGRFGPFAALVIRRCLRRVLNQSERPIRLPEQLTEVLRAIHAARPRLHQALEREPTQSEIATAIGQPEALVGRALRADRAVLSLDQPVGSDDRPLAATIPACEEVDEQRSALVWALGQLDPQEQQFLRLRYLDGDGRSSEQARAELGISQRRACATEAEALRRLRQLLDQPEPQRPQEEGPPRAIAGAPPPTEDELQRALEALDGAPTMRSAAGRSGYERTVFQELLARARLALGLPTGRQQRYRPAQLARELRQALEARAAEVPIEG